MSDVGCRILPSRMSDVGFKQVDVGFSKSDVGFFKSDVGL